MSSFHYCSLALTTFQDIVKEHHKSAACGQPCPGHLAKISKALEPTSHGKTTASKEKTNSSSASNNEQDDLEEDRDAKPRRKRGPGGSISEGPQPPSRSLLRDLDDFEQDIAVECFLLYCHWILTRDAFLHEKLHGAWGLAIVKQVALKSGMAEDQLKHPSRQLRAQVQLSS